MRPPVIAGVARVAGVSVPTVSRVLSGTTRVSPERRERVLAAIRELGFRPNAAARALSTGSQLMIVVFAGDTTRFGYAATIQGVNNWHLIFVYVTLMSLPLLLVFVLAQRKIISGITSGAVK